MFSEKDYDLASSIIWTMENIIMKPNNPSITPEERLRIVCSKTREESIDLNTRFYAFYLACSKLPSNDHSPFRVALSVASKKTLDILNDEFSSYFDKTFYDKVEHYRMSEEELMNKISQIMK
jgi:hypothetical protein